jgi:hypothetical protein
MGTGRSLVGKVTDVRHVDERRFEDHLSVFAGLDVEAGPFELRQLAIHAKLDEILHVMGDARNELTRVDEEEPEEIEKRRRQMRKDD